MDRTPQIATLAAALLLGSGCAATDKIPTSVTSLKQSIGLDQAEPVSQVLTRWAPRLGTLDVPDGVPKHDGDRVSGVVGQVFMLTPSSQPAESRGDLTFVVYDATERPPGQPERTPEMFHFDQKALARLRTKDDRMGPCYAVFLPLPAGWTEATNLRILTRYQAPGGPAIQSPESLVRIDAELSPMHSKYTYETKVGGAMTPDPAPKDRRGVPDLAKMLATVQTRPAAPAQAAPPQGPQPQAFARSNVPVTDGGRNAPPVMTAVARTPVVQPLAPGANTTYATEGAYAGPKPGGPGPLDNIDPAAVNGPVQPIVIRRE